MLSKNPGSELKAASNREADELRESITTGLNSAASTNLHIHASDEIVLRFTKGYVKVTRTSRR